MSAGAGQFEPSFMSRTRGKGSSAAAGTAFSARLLPKEPEERLEEQLEEEGDRQTSIVFFTGNYLSNILYTVWRRQAHHR